MIPCITQGWAVFRTYQRPLSFMHLISINWQIGPHFICFLGAHNVAIFPLWHYLVLNGPKLPSGSSTVGYECFLNMLYDTKMVCLHDFHAYVTIADLFVLKFMSIEFSDQAPGTGIAIFPWMGLLGCKLQVMLFDHTRLLLMVEELASYVPNMGPLMMLPLHALGIRGALWTACTLTAHPEQHNSPMKCNRNSSNNLWLAWTSLLS